MPDKRKRLTRQSDCRGRERHAVEVDDVGREVINESKGFSLRQPPLARDAEIVEVGANPVESAIGDRAVVEACNFRRGNCLNLSTLVEPYQ